MEDEKLFLDLYAIRDNHAHPSTLGSYLAACVLYNAIFNRKPKNIDIGNVYGKDRDVLWRPKTAVLRKYSDPRKILSNL
eukprot:UN16503